jgi:hypothetical protein
MINPMRFVKNELIQRRRKKKIQPSLLQPESTSYSSNAKNDFQIIQVADHFIIIST